MAFPNVYTHRRVAQSNARSCDICYKPSTSVLITPDNKDWFYVCPSHLKDPAFCTPKIDHAAIEARKERELQEEVARLKEEYEERQKRKREKAGEDGNKDGSGDKNKEDKPSEDEARTQNKPESAGAGKEGAGSSPEEEEPRVFELKSTFYQQRLNRKRQAEIAKRNRERLQDPNFFPSVPKNLPS